MLWPLVEIAFPYLMRLYAGLWFRCRPVPPPPLPATGPAILICNHTCSADPVFLCATCPRLISYLTAREHYQALPIFRALLDRGQCVPVQRSGCDVVAARRSLRRLQEGCVLGIFIEGNLSGLAIGRMRAPKHGAAWLALRSGAPVFPAWIEGGPRTRHLLQAWLGGSSRPTRVYYGPEIDLSVHRRQPLTRRLLHEVSELFVRRIQELRPRQDG